MATKVEQLFEQVICKDMDSSNGIYSRGYVLLEGTPLLGMAAVDPIGGPAQVQGKDFQVVNNRLYFRSVPGVTETAPLAGSDILSVADRYPSYQIVLRVIYNVG